MSQTHNYNGVLIIILCSLYYRIYFSFFKWFQSYFKQFKTIRVWTVVSILSVSAEGNNPLCIS